MVYILLRSPDTLHTAPTRLQQLTINALRCRQQSFRANEAPKQAPIDNGSYMGSDVRPTTPCHGQYATKSMFTTYAECVVCTE